MKIDELGLPQVNGSTDLQDSAALAGIMTVFEWPQSIPIGLYTNWNLKRYDRHPFEFSYDFSRDQAVCLIAGYGKARAFYNVKIEYITGKDFLSPSVRGHIARCQGKKSSWFQDLWFWADLYFSAKFKPLDELNQLFCMMLMADPKFIKWYCKANSQWERAIRKYWHTEDGAWRNEPVLAEHMIWKIKAAI